METLARLIISSTCGIVSPIQFHQLNCLTVCFEPIPDLRFGAVQLINHIACLDRSHATSSSWSSIAEHPSKMFEIQSIAEDSYITRTTEVTASKEESADVLGAPMSKVQISADVPASDEYAVEVGSEMFVI
jgi:hypothetical protein